MSHLIVQGDGKSIKPPTGKKGLYTAKNRDGAVSLAEMASAYGFNDIVDRTRVIPWDILPLDILTGGIGIGRPVQLSGVGGSGKSLLSAWAMTRMHQYFENEGMVNPTISVLDSERGWNSELAYGAGLGIPLTVKQLGKHHGYWHLGVTTIEKTWDWICDICVNNMRINDPEHPEFVNMMIWDSLGTAPLEAEQVTSSGEAHMMRAPITHGRGASRAKQLIYDSGIVFILINRVYTDTSGAMPRDQESGGRKLAHFTDTGVRLWPYNPYHKPGEIVRRHNMGFKTFKNKINKPINMSGKFSLRVAPDLTHYPYPDIAWYAIMYHIIVGKDGNPLEKWDIDKAGSASEMTVNGAQSGVFAVDGTIIGKLGKNLVDLVDWLQTHLDETEEILNLIFECDKLNCMYENLEERKKSHGEILKIGAWTPISHGTTREGQVSAMADIRTDAAKL